MSTNQITLKMERNKVLKSFDTDEIKNKKTEQTIGFRLQRIDKEMQKDQPNELPF